MMKKYLMVCVLSLLAVQVMGQPALGRGTETKKTDALELAQGCYVGQYGKLDCWLSEGKKHQQVFTMMNLNLVEQYSAVLPDSKDYRVLAAGMDASTAAVLVASEGEKKRTVLGRYRVQLAGCTAGAMDTLRVLEYGKKDECMVWGAVSPSGNHMAVAAIVEFTEKSEYGTWIALFDAAGEVEWSQEFALGTMSDLMVTDDGRIITLGQEPGGEELGIVVNLLTKGHARSSKVFMRCDPIPQLRLAAVHGDHLLAVGTYGMPGGKKNEHLVSGMLAFSFNLDSASLTNFSVRLFNNEEINILYNKNTKRIQKDLVADSYDLIDIAPTPFGCAALYGRRYRLEYSNAAGQTVYDYVCMGLNCMAVDTLGQIKWVRNIRRNDLQKEDGDMLNASVMEANGRTSVVKSEHKKYPAGYDVAKEAKEMTVGSKVNTVLYSFDEAGEGQKIIVEKGVKQNLLRTYKRHDGSLLMLSKAGSKSRAAELRFVY